MRYYAPKKGKYILPRDLYMQVIFMIKDYDRMKETAEDLLEETSSPDGQPRGNSISDTVASKAIKRETLLAKIKAIDESFNDCPIEYRQGVRNNITDRTRYPCDADRKTYTRQKGRVIYNIAKRLYWV